MKRKCDGRHPCTRCERRNRDCFYSCKQKSGPPKGSKRKLVEAEDDLPENRPTKPNVPMWSRSAMMSQQNCRAPPPTETKPVETAPAPGPSPEARAAAAAAVAATRMNALAPAVPPAMAPAGMHPQYMLRPPPVLPGLSGGSVPVGAPLVAHPRYGTVYQHQYPAEVYAVYLAELRHRSASANNIGKDTCNFRSDAPTIPAPISGRLGDMGATSAEAAKAAATTLAADVAAAGGFTPDASGGKELASTGSELLSEAANFVEQRAGAREQSGAESIGDVVPDREALDHVSKMAAEGWGGSSNEPAKEAAASAAASAALAAAVAAAIAEGSPPDARDDSSPAETADGGAGSGSSGIDFADCVPPAKGTRFDAVPEMKTVAATPTVGEMPAAVETTGAMVKSEIEGYSCGSDSRAATQRERQAAAGLLLYGVNSHPVMPSIAATTTSGHHANGGGKSQSQDESENGNVKVEGELQHCQRNSPNAAVEVSGCKGSGSKGEGGAHRGWLVSTMDCRFRVS